MQLCLGRALSKRSLSQHLSSFVTTRYRSLAEQFNQVKSSSTLYVPQFPLSGFLPPGVQAASKAFNLILCPQVFQDVPDHFHADVRALVLKFGHADSADDAVDSVKNETRFLALGTLNSAEALLEFPIGQNDDGKNVIDVWPSFRSSTLTTVILARRSVSVK